MYRELQPFREALSEELKASKFRDALTRSARR